MTSAKPSLPYHKVLGGIPLRFDWFDLSRIDEAHQLYKEAGDNFDGYTPQEVTKERIYNLAKNNFGMLVYDDRTDEVVCSCVAIRSQMCRSAHPMCSGGLAVVKKSHRGKGILKCVNYISLRYVNHSGYIGEYIPKTVTLMNMLRFNCSTL